MLVRLFMPALLENIKCRSRFSATSCERSKLLIQSVLGRSSTSLREASSPTLNLGSTLATQFKIPIFRDKHQFFPAGYRIGLATDIRTEGQIQGQPEFLTALRLQSRISCHLLDLS